MDNAYAYDAVSNVLSVANKAALPESGKAGGQMAHAYTYDALYRLASATGTYAGADSKTASCRLEMGYDNMHRIVSKKRHLTQQGEQLYVNSEFAGGRTNTAKFSLYVSPYLVANQGGRYTKHIYIGSQRIVSKIGDFASYGSDPRRIRYAGSETDGLSVNYKQFKETERIKNTHFQQTEDYCLWNYSISVIYRLNQIKTKYRGKTSIKQEIDRL